MNAAKAAGATYCDVRVGRYLRQFVITREANVQNIVNTESTGVGVRVIAGGAWGFAATNTMTTDAVAKAARQAVAIAKANAPTLTEPVQLAPTPGVGEVSWRTPIVKNAMEVPIKDKVDLLLGVNAAAMGAGADFIQSMLFLVNEQKYFASTDGSYIDQDVHRIWVRCRRRSSTRRPASSAAATACPPRWVWASNIWTARLRARRSCPTASSSMASPTT
jgi:TldD protein